MNRVWLSIFTALSLAALAPPARAAIEFDERLVEIHAEPGAEKVVARFTYRNTGTVRQRIHRIDSNCDCLSAEVDRRVVRPGESGTLEAIFNVKGKSGGIGKSLEIFTKLGFSSPIKLDVHVFIPKVIVMEPQVVVWKQGDKPTPKTVQVKVQTEEPIRILNHSSSRRDVSAELREVEEGRLYELEISPRTTANPLLGVVRMETDCRIDGQHRQLAFFRIER